MKKQRGRCYKKKVRSKVWRPKPKVDDEEDDKLQADINMVVFLPKEFMAPVDSDMSVEELGMAQLTLEPRQAIFEKPDDEKRQHLKAFVSQRICQWQTSHQDACGWRSSSQLDAIHHAEQDCEI
jgi:hypothetical protein